MKPVGKSEIRKDWLSASMSDIRVSESKSEHGGRVRRHYEVHMDYNKTAVARDGAKKLDVKDVALNLLVDDLRFAHTFGGMKEKMTFRAFLEKTMPRETKEEKNAIRERYKEFFDALKGTDKEKGVKKLYDRIVNQKTVVFPSVYQLIEWLEKRDKETGESKRTYNFIWRTFGTDAKDEGVPEVNAWYKAKYGKAFVTKEGTRKGEAIEVDGKTYDSYWHFQREMKAGEHYFIQDDFPHWNKHKKEYAYGKPFVAREGAVFFDDNAEEQGLKGIICRLSADKGEKEGSSKDILGKHVIAVDTLSAIENEKYFVEWMKKV